MENLVVFEIDSELTASPKEILKYFGALYSDELVIVTII